MIQVISVSYDYSPAFCHGWLIAPIYFVGVDSACSAGRIASS